jgi:hypothetical protein
VFAGLTIFLSHKEQNMLAERRKQLLAEFRKGIGNKETIDKLLGVEQASLEEDFRVTLHLASLTKLHMLEALLRQGRVTRRAYVRISASGVKGCFGNILFGWRNNEDLVNFDYPDEATLDNACRALRAWDYELLDGATALRIVTEAIEERMWAKPAEPAAARQAAREACLATVAVGDPSHSEIATGEPPVAMFGRLRAGIRG